MTKDKLIEENERLEQELFNAKNSIEYWSNSYYSVLNMYDNLKLEITDDELNTFLSKCSIVQKEKLLEIIKTL